MGSENYIRRIIFFFFTSQVILSCVDASLCIYKANLGNMDKGKNQYWELITGTPVKYSLLK